MWWKPKRVIKELWRYGCILSWNERTNLGGVFYKRWARWWYYNRCARHRIGRCPNINNQRNPPTTIRILKHMANVNKVNIVLSLKRPKNSASVYLNVDIDLFTRFY